MKKLSIAIIIALVVPAIAFAEEPQERRKFSPQEFVQKREEFISREAGLTAAEGSAIFPLMRKMEKERMEIDRKVGSLMHRGSQPGISEKEAQSILEQIDKLTLEKTKLENAYHQKYRKAIPAGKVLRVYQADWKFSRQVLKHMSRQRPGPPKQQPKQQ